MATVVFVHAHPDDEAILTAGTMRALAEAAHRVILVIVTDGGEGLSTHSAETLIAIRRHEAEESAKALMVSDVIWLGYADSGLEGKADSGRLSLTQVPTADAAAALADVLVRNRADAVVGYDRYGGYGHPDHRKVHEIVAAAAEIAGTTHVFEATIDRQLITRVFDPLNFVLKHFSVTWIDNLVNGFTARADITHVVTVTPWQSAKRKSMSAHTSQLTGGYAPRSLSIFLKLPAPLYRKFFGREWFRQSHGHHYDNPIAELPTCSVSF